MLILIDFIKYFLIIQPNLWGAILPSWVMLWLWTTFASIITGFLSSSTGSWVNWILWLTTNRGLLDLNTSSLREIPSKYCFKRDLSIVLSFTRAYFCFWIAKRSRRTLLCLLKKLFKYLNSSYYSGVSSWNWFFISYEI